jgi:uncharacterized protein
MRARGRPWRRVKTATLTQLLCLTAVSAIATSLNAAEITVEGSSSNLTIIRISGDFAEGDGLRFKELAQHHKDAIVLLRSDGGFLLSGIIIGETIRTRQYSTYVGDGWDCASACALAWLGGKRRLMAPGARIGFHAAYDRQTGEQAGPGNALIGAYLAKLGLSYIAVAYLTKSPPKSMTWLTEAAAREIGIELEGFDGDPRELALLPPTPRTDELVPNPPIESVSIGVAAYETGDYDTAFRIFTEHASRGDAVAQFTLGYMYRNGRGIPQSYPDALIWYRRAAEQGNMYAQHNLGLMYANAQGVLRDDSQAVIWFRLAAAQEYASAQYNLALTLHRGHKADYAEAAKWYRRAAENGDAWAQLNLGYLYGAGKGVLRDKREALIWYRRAADQGNTDAMFNIAREFYDGDGSSRDYAEAARWLHLASERGHAKAQNNLGAMYKDGIGVKQDQREAVKWFLRGAQQGDAAAQFNLAIMYAQGYGVARDNMLAHMWFNIAGARGEQRAFKNREIVAGRLKPDQLAKAQQMAREWRPKPERANE